MPFRIQFWLIALLMIPALGFGAELQVNITGLNVALTKAVRADLTLQQAITEQKLTEARIKNLYYIATEQITTTLQAKGYYNSNISSTLIEKNKWIATFAITLGKPTRVASINIAIDGPGENNNKLKAALNNLKHKIIVGKIITHADYEDTKEELLANQNLILNENILTIFFLIT